jgi:hypothetical protein
MLIILLSHVAAPAQTVRVRLNPLPPLSDGLLSEVVFFPFPPEVRILVSAIQVRLIPLVGLLQDSGDDGSR